jgi:hypothetical protein
VQLLDDYLKELRRQMFSVPPDRSKQDKDGRSLFQTGTEQVQKVGQTIGARSRFIRVQRARPVVAEWQTGMYGPPLVLDR